MKGKIVNEKYIAIDITIPRKGNSHLPKRVTLILKGIYQVGIGRYEYRSEYYFDFQSKEKRKPYKVTRLSCDSQGNLNFFYKSYIAGEVFKKIQMSYTFKLKVWDYTDQIRKEQRKEKLVKLNGLSDNGTEMLVEN